MARGPWLRERRLRIAASCRYCGKAIYTHLRRETRTRRVPSHKGACWVCSFGKPMPARPALKWRRRFEELHQRLRCDLCGREFWRLNSEVRKQRRRGVTAKYCQLRCSTAMWHWARKEYERKAFVLKSAQREANRVSRKGGVPNGAN